MQSIEITLESIRTQSSNVRKYKSNHEQIMIELRQLVMQLDSAWKGEAQDAFVAKFVSMDFLYKKFADTLEEYAKLLDRAASDLQNTDNGLKSSIDKIS